MFFVSRFFEGWELLLIDGDTEDIEAWIEAKENQQWERKSIEDMTEHLENGHVFVRESDEED